MLPERFPVLDYKIAEVGERVESMRREVDKHGDTGAEHLQDTRDAKRRSKKLPVFQGPF